MTEENEYSRNPELAFQKPNEKAKILSIHNYWRNHVKCERLVHECYTKNILTQFHFERFRAFKTRNEKAMFLYEILLERATYPMLQKVREVLYDSEQYDLAYLLPVRDMDTFWTPEKRVKLNENPFVEEHCRQEIQQAFTTWVERLKPEIFMQDCLMHNLCDTHDIEYMTKLETKEERCTYLFDNVLRCATWPEIEKIKEVLITEDQNHMAELLPSRQTQRPSTPRPVSSQEDNPFLDREEERQVKQLYGTFIKCVVAESFMVDCYTEGLLTDRQRQVFSACQTNTEKSKNLFETLLDRCTYSQLQKIKQILYNSQEEKHKELANCIPTRKT